MTIETPEATMPPKDPGLIADIVWGPHHQHTRFYDSITPGYFQENLKLREPGERAFFEGMIVYYKDEPQPHILFGLGGIHVSFAMAMMASPQSFPHPIIHARGFSLGWNDTLRLVNFSYPYIENGKLVTNYKGSLDDQSLIEKRKVLRALFRKISPLLDNAPQRIPVGFSRTERDSTYREYIRDIHRLTDHISYQDFKTKAGLTS